jgi:hypothetical protein
LTHFFHLVDHLIELSVEVTEMLGFLNRKCSDVLIQLTLNGMDADRKSCDPSSQSTRGDVPAQKSAQRASRG